MLVWNSDGQIIYKETDIWFPMMMKNHGFSIARSESQPFRQDIEASSRRWLPGWQSNGHQVHHLTVMRRSEFVREPFLEHKTYQELAWYIILLTMAQGCVRYIKIWFYHALPCVFPYFLARVYHGWPSPCPEFRMIPTVRRTSWGRTCMVGFCSWMTLGSDQWCSLPYPTAGLQIDECGRLWHGMIWHDL